MNGDPSSLDPATVCQIFVEQEERLKALDYRFDKWTGNLEAHRDLLRDFESLIAQIEPLMPAFLADEYLSGTANALLHGAKHTCNLIRRDIDDSEELDDELTEEERMEEMYQ